MDRAFIHPGRVDPLLPEGARDLLQHLLILEDHGQVIAHRLGVLDHLRKEQFRMGPQPFHQSLAVLRANAVDLFEPGQKPSADPGLQAGVTPRIKPRVDLGGLEGRDHGIEQAVEEGPHGQGQRREFHGHLNLEGAPGRRQAFPFDSDTLGDVIGVRRGNAPVEGGEILSLAQTETGGMAQGTDLPSVQPRPGGLAGVLEDKDVPLRNDPPNGFDGARVAEHVHRNHAEGVIRDDLRESLRVQVERTARDVAEPCFETRPIHGQRQRGNGIRGQHDLVLARQVVKRFENQVEGRRSGAGEKRMFHPDHARKSLFESRDRITWKQQPRETGRNVRKRQGKSRRRYPHRFTFRASNTMAGAHKTKGNRTGIRRIPQTPDSCSLLPISKNE